VNVLDTFLIDSLKALQFLFIAPFWSISLGTLVVLGVATVTTFRERGARARPKGLYLFPLLLLVAFPVAIAIGVIFEAPPQANPNRAGILLLKALITLAVLFAIYCVYRAKGIRPFTTVLVIAELWLIIVAALLAYVSIAPVSIGDDARPVVIWENIAQRRFDISHDFRYNGS
jgi:urea transporter